MDNSSPFGFDLSDTKDIKEEIEDSTLYGNENHFTDFQPWKKNNKNESLNQSFDDLFDDEEKTPFNISDNDIASFIKEDFDTDDKSYFENSDTSFPQQSQTFEKNSNISRKDFLSNEVSNQSHSTNFEMKQSSCLSKPMNLFETANELVTSSRNNNNNNNDDDSCENLFMRTLQSEQGKHFGSDTCLNSEASEEIPFQRCKMLFSSAKEKFNSQPQNLNLAHSSNSQFKSNCSFNKQFRNANNKPGNDGDAPGSHKKEKINLFQLASYRKPKTGGKFPTDSTEKNQYIFEDKQILNKPNHLVVNLSDDFEKESTRKHTMLDIKKDNETPVTKPQLVKPSFKPVFKKKVAETVLSESSDVNISFGNKKEKTFKSQQDLYSPSKASSCILKVSDEIKSKSKVVRNKKENINPKQTSSMEVVNKGQNNHTQASDQTKNWLISKPTVSPSLHVVIPQLSKVKNIEIGSVKKRSNKKNCSKQNQEKNNINAKCVQNFKGKFPNLYAKNKKKVTSPSKYKSIIELTSDCTKKTVKNNNSHEGTKLIKEIKTGLDCEVKRVNGMGSKIEGICHKNEDCNSPNISEFDSFENLTLNSETSHQRKNLSEKDTMKEFPTSTADLDSTFAEGNTEVNCEKELPKSASLMSQIRNEKTDHPILKWNEQKNLLKMRKTNVRNALELASSSLKSNLKVKKLRKHRTSLKKLKKNDPKLTFIKERLYQLQEQTTSPVWVQCDSCTKWRCLKNVEDPAMLPKNWTCSLNSDTEYSSCIIPEESYDEKEHDDTFVFNKYTLGSVVWVTSFGPGWWPAMVDDDPDTETFFWLPKSSNVPNFYHVTFFGPEVSRAWVRSNCVVPFVPGKERVSKATKKVHQALKIAVAEAKLSLTLPLNDRRRIYCFVTRYKGSWFMNTPSQDFREMSN